jgi:membrane-associated phospholipid phosphatase
LKLTVKEPALNSPRSLILAVVLGGVLVIVCYFYVDRPVAWFVHNHRFYSDKILVWAPRISDWLTYLVIVAIIGVVASWIWRPGGAIRTLLVAIALNLVATNAIKSGLKCVFGRTWPETWTDHNPSLIADGVYGFHPFHFSNAYQSFPSGHAAAAFALISILWLSYPRWRWIYAIAGGIACFALVGLNFHFVSDVIAGAMLGSTTGFYATWLFGLLPPACIAPQPRK